LPKGRKRNPANSSQGKLDGEGRLWTRTPHIKNRLRSKRAEKVKNTEKMVTLSQPELLVRRGGKRATDTSFAERGSFNRPPKDFGCVRRPIWAGRKACESGKEGVELERGDERSSSNRNRRGESFERALAAKYR